MKTGMFLGMLTGIMIGLIIVVIILKAANKDGKVKTTYDERQERVRGKGFRYAFFTILSESFVMILLDVAGLEIPICRPVLDFIIPVIGTMVYATYAIMHDGYFGLNNKRSNYMVAFLTIAFFNGILTIIHASRGELIIDGKLDLAGINLVCLLMFVWLFGILIIKKLCDDREEGDDD